MECQLAPFAPLPGARGSFVLPPLSWLLCHWFPHLSFQHGAQTAAARASVAWWRGTWPRTGLRHASLRRGTQWGCSSVQPGRGHPHSGTSCMPSQLVLWLAKLFGHSLIYLHPRQSTDVLRKCLVEVLQAHTSMVQGMLIFYTPHRTCLNWCWLCQHSSSVSVYPYPVTFSNLVTTWAIKGM